MRKKTLVARLQTRELHVLGDSWRDVVGIDAAVVSELIARADAERLSTLHQYSDPADSVDVLVGADRIGLWLGDARVAVMER